MNGFGQYYYRGPQWRRRGWYRRHYGRQFPDRVSRSLWPYAGFGQTPPTVEISTPVATDFIKSHAGYSYRMATEQQTSGVLSEISTSEAVAVLVAEGTSYVGVVLPKESVMAGKKGIPGKPLIQWIHERAAEGYGLIVSDLEHPSLTPMPQVQGVEGLVVATKDIRVASGITAKDDSSAVILEPTGGWQTASGTPTPTKKAAAVPAAGWAILAVLGVMGVAAIASQRKRG